MKYCSNLNRNHLSMIFLILIPIVFLIGCFFIFKFWQGKVSLPTYYLFGWADYKPDTNSPLNAGYYLFGTFAWLWCVFLPIPLFLEFSNIAEVGFRQRIIDLENISKETEQSVKEAAALENEIICTKCQCKSCLNQNNSDGILWFFAPFLLIFIFIIH